MLVADQGVDVDVLEGHLVHELEPHHDHPGHPEEDDVEPRDHQRGRVEVFELRCLVRPAHRGEGPERAAEPGVQDVLVLDDVRPPALFAGRRVRLGHGDVSAVGTGPCRDAVPPPELARDAPVPDVLHPLEIGLLPLFGNPRDASVLHGLDAPLGQGFGPDEPLLGQVGLDGRAAPLAVPHGVRDRLGADQETLRLEVPGRGLSGLLDRHSPVLAGVLVHDALGVDDLKLRQVVAQPHQEVVGVVRGRDLHAARPELGVHHVVLDDRDIPVRQGHAHPLADQAAVLLRPRMDGYGRVPDDRLRTRRRHDDLPRPVDERIADVIEVTRLLFVLHLQVGEGRVAARAPVDDVLAPVDQVLLVEAHEHGTHGAR